MKKLKPRTSGSRHQKKVDYKDLTTSTANKSLTKLYKKSKGRNSSGSITVRHKGGGNKKKYRTIDIKRKTLNIPAKVVSIEYDPFRGSFISLISYENGLKSYILTPHKVKVGDIIKNTDKSSIQSGDCLELAHIPIGTQIHNIEIHPGKGFQLCRGAGTYATLNAKVNGYANIKLPSGEIRLFPLNCKAVIGRVSNINKKDEVIGKAGLNRHRGKRPTVRGSVMNPADHPHGGGEGRAPIGRPNPRTPWGKIATLKTRKKKNINKLIVRSRKGK